MNFGVLAEYIFGLLTIVWVWSQAVLKQYSVTKEERRKNLSRNLSVTFRQFSEWLCIIFVCLRVCILKNEMFWEHGKIEQYYLQFNLISHNMYEYTTMITVYSKDKYFVHFCLRLILWSFVRTVQCSIVQYSLSSWEMLFFTVSPSSVQYGAVQ